MPTYQELIEKYKKRKHDTLVDAVTVGLSYADNVVVDLGLLEDTGLLTETLETVSNVLPFAIIAVTEQFRVIMGRKSEKAAVTDTAYRAVKTGASLGVGALVTVAGGPLLAIPAAVATRVVMDRFKSRALTGMRVSRRTRRLSELRRVLEQRQLELSSDQVIGISGEEARKMIAEEKAIPLSELSEAMAQYRMENEAIPARKE